MGISKEEARELREQLEEAYRQIYAMFYYERVPFAKVYKWNINGRNPFGEIIHVPHTLPGAVKTEDAAKMLVYTYTTVFCGFTKGEVEIMLNDPAKAELEAFMKKRGESA